ncbi:MAG: hypothetical protein L0271_11080 [Gemmatimonadetes bacterium]|nr:hypothetical protein [Gemmatimonadota bacterium]
MSSRSRTLGKRHRRTLIASVIASGAVHAALFAAMKFEYEPLSAREAEIAAVAVKPVEFVPVDEEPIEVIRLRGAFTSTAPMPEGGGAADTPPLGVEGASFTAAASAALLSEPLLVTGTEPAFERLTVVDPMTQAAVEPIAFADLPAAETAAEVEDGDDGVEVYIPGSVGKAKRQWAKGIGEDESGDGRGAGLSIGIGGGGGHCPMPGRGRIPVSW